MIQYNTIQYIAVYILTRIYSKELKEQGIDQDPEVGECHFQGLRIQRQRGKQWRGRRFKQQRPGPGLQRREPKRPARTEGGARRGQAGGPRCQHRGPN